MSDNLPKPVNPRTDRAANGPRRPPATGTGLWSQLRVNGRSRTCLTIGDGATADEMQISGRWIKSTVAVDMRGIE